MTRATSFLRITFATLLLLLGGVEISAQPGTVHRVQTLTYDSPQEGRFVMPSDTLHVEKILMHYKLRCPFDGPCGEWDYLMYIHLFDHTGMIDSVTDTAASYRVNGAAPDSFAVMWNPSWLYFPRIIYTATRLDTVSFKSGLVGTGTTPIDYPFGDGVANSRSQFLWRASELKTASLSAGGITGMRFNVGTAGVRLQHATIRMKGVTRDSLTPEFMEKDGFTTVYANDISFGATGWSTVSFPTPFVWNGTSNIVVDISYDAGTPGAPSILMGSDAPFKAGLRLVSDNRAYHFEGANLVSVPKEALATIDSNITISFWAYGNSQYQPQNQSIFEGVDDAGRRVVNMHLPWSDKSVYWDAGTGGSYDRVMKAIDSTIWEGRWNHWVVTKNATSKVMRIYLNGLPWALGSSKAKRMRGMTTFNIGAFGNGSNNYDGDVDEFAMWDIALDGNAVKALYQNDLNPAATFPENLRFYYKFNDRSLTSITDASGRGYNGRLVGPPISRPVAGSELFSNFIGTTTRPNVQFEQGVFTTRIDTTVKVDSLEANPVVLVRYRDQVDPGKPTDTLTVWPAGYNRYSFDKTGLAVDSARVVPDSVFHLVRTPYMRKFERVDRYEIGRYITPYGNGLTLGEGFTWTYDVSDYRTLLHDTIHLAAYNQQELVDISFEFIEGTPPRDPIKVENVWVGSPGYGLTTSIEEFLTPRKVWIAPNTDTRLKMRTTGHGFGGNENCAEFCPKHHMILVDGTMRYDTVVWKENCGLNPVYPQGGTWVYNRSNWCPGDLVPTYDMELTPYVTGGDSATLDYNLEDYTWNGQGSTPYYSIETQVVTYSKPNFTLDASLEDIKSPSRTDLYRRMNPICGGPVVTIKNTGSTPLTSLTFTYGIDGGAQSNYTWTGNLPFLGTTDVKLPQFNWSSTGRTFRVTIGAPNGGADEYATNNSRTTEYNFPPVYPSGLIFELKTNNSGEETSYEIRNDAGALVHERKNLSPATVYKDTLNLPDGCYEFRLLDQGGDGLSWWANTAAGNGYMRIRRLSTNVTLITFNADFGSEIYQQFTVGYDLSGVDLETSPTSSDHLAVFPNPSNGTLTVALQLGTAQDVVITVQSLLGSVVYEKELPHTASQNLDIDLAAQPAGTYVVTARTASGTLTRKVIIQ